MTGVTRRSLSAMDERGWTTVDDVEALAALVGEPARRAVEKERDHLLDVDLAWLRASAFCVLATAGADGACDASPKGDPAGSLVHVLDRRTLAVAERPGNRRVDGYRNVLENPHVGLLFLLSGRDDTLRVNGRARLVSDAPFLDEMTVRGHRPLLALVVDVEQVFFHCSKAFLRANLWEPETWRPFDEVPRRAVIAHDVEPDGRSLEELDAYYGPAYAEGLYR